VTILGTSSAVSLISNSLIAKTFSHLVLFRPRTARSRAAINRTSISLPLPPSAIMQQPTCTNTRIRSTQDAHKIFFAVQHGILPLVTRRLDADERLALRSGCVYAWEERGSHAEITGLGIERFTEGRRWSPSRVRDVSWNVIFHAPHLNIILRNFYFTMKNTLHRTMLHSRSSSSRLYFGLC